MPDPLPKPPGRPPGEPIIIKHPPPPPDDPEMEGSLDDEDDPEIERPPRIMPEMPPPPAPWERARVVAIGAGSRQSHRRRGTTATPACRPNPPQLEVAE